jgi:hypothetical protein
MLNDKVVNHDRFSLKRSTIFLKKCPQSCNGTDNVDSVKSVAGYPVEFL